MSNERERMRLPLDDAQIARHAMGQMAEQASILEAALKEVGFSDYLREEMVLIWWRTLISSALTPNLGEIIQTMLEQGGEEDA